jgi:hypothetical protein
MAVTTANRATVTASQVAGDPNARVPRPVFVIGSIRSGASLLTLCLGQHPDMQPVLETNWFERFGVGLQESYEQGIAPGVTSQLDAAGTTIEDFYAYFGKAIDRFLLDAELDDLQRSCPANVGVDTGSRLFPASRYRPSRWIDGTPANRYCVPILLRLFPHAKFIHILRDVGEVVTLVTSDDYQPIYLSRHLLMAPAAAYRQWLEEVNACVDAERTFGSGTVMRILRSELISNPEPTLRRCLDFLGEPFDEACLWPLNPVGAVQPTSRFSWRDAFGDRPPAVCIAAERRSARLLAEGTPSYARDEERIRELAFAAQDEEKLAGAVAATGQGSNQVERRPPSGFRLLERLKNGTTNRPK